ncbi:MAG: SMC-Scp complex subunit ScpB [Sedimentitalea sp.]
MTQDFDADLADLPPELRWREWMNRIEAVLFASATPVGREALTPLVGQGANVDLLVQDIQAELGAKPYEIIEVAGCWMFRTRPRYASAVRAAADLGQPALAFNEHELAVLCSIAYHQPIGRAGLAEIFGKEVNRDLIARLRNNDLIANGPREPRAGAPQSFVTTDHFLATFGLESLRDLMEMQAEQEPVAPRFTPPAASEALP